MISNHSSSDVALVAFDKNSQFDERFIVGADLGQSHDPTAIAVVRRLERWPQKPLFQVGYLARLPLGTPYPAVVTHVTQMLGRPPLRGKVELVIDFTGVGRPVFEMFVGRGVSPIGVTITAGDATTNDGLIYRVPKIELISRVQALLHDGRLKIHKELPDAPVLVSELQDFKADVTDSGYWKFGARAGKHDDLVLALAIALWRANGNDSHSKWMEFMRGVGRGSPEAEASQTPRITLKAPAGVTHVHSIKGRAVNVGDAGTVELDEEEARPLLQGGWQSAA
jgi:hypothetical protein